MPQAGALLLRQLVKTMTDKKTAKKASQTTAKVAGIPVTADTPTYQAGGRSEDLGPRLVGFLAENANQGFTEPMLAEAFGFYRDGKPHQQRINGPMRKVWDRLTETHDQPDEVPAGHELRCFAANVAGRSQKTWAVVKLN